MILGNFVSIWDDGIEISTPAELNETTGEITTESVDVENVEILQREMFVNKHGGEFEVCPECHEYILKTVIKEGIGKTLYEASVCSNPDCDNH